MKDKLKKFFQALWTATKTTLIIWTNKAMVKHLEKNGYEVYKK